MDRRRKRLGWSAGNPMDYVNDSRIPQGDSVWGNNDRYTKGRINWAVTPQTQQMTRNLRDMLSGTGVPDWGNAAYGKTPEDTRKLQAINSMFNAAALPAGRQPAVRPMSEYQLSNNSAVKSAYGVAARQMNEEAERLAGIQEQEIANQEAEMQAALEERKKQEALGRLIAGGV